MQAKGIHVEPLFSNPGNPNNTTALLETIVKLKQDVKLCQQEKNAVVEQLNCLISLIKRSWTGDNNASLHLANIVGLPPPEFDYRASHLTNTPVPDKAARAAILWERLSIKLLDKNYAEIQEEIRERQMLYMQNRQLYMDEVLHHHQIEMSKTPVRKNSKTYDEVDRRFINAYSKLHQGVITDRSNVTLRNNRGSPRTKQGSGMKQRIKSAPPRARTAKDMVNGSNLKMKDLFISNKAGEVREPQTSHSDSKSFHVSNTGPVYVKNRVVDYDDPQRYGPTNLFDLDAVFGPDGERKKSQRPTSAFIPRGQTSGSKSRPQSGHNAFITQKSERPMKYETTRPVSGKAMPRKNSQSKLKSTLDLNTGQMTYIPTVTTQDYREEQEINDDENRNNSENDEDKTHIQDVEYESDIDYEEYNKPPMKVRVNSAPQRRPAHVDKFVTELQAMEEMEKDFKKSAIHLQKKLGIDLNGMVS